MSDPNQSRLNEAKKALMQSQFEQAISICNQILSDRSDSNSEKESLYLIAVALRMAQQPRDALHTLDKLLQRFPDYGRGFQEQGYCWKALGDERNMATAFYRATRFNPTLLPAWRELVQFYTKTGNQQALNVASQHIQHLSALPKPLIGAMDLLHEGQLHKAEQVCRSYLQANKHHPDAMMLLAEIGLQLKVYHDAEFLLESCVALYPKNEPALVAYQSLLNKLGKFPVAAKLARKRVADNPDNAQAKITLAFALVGVGELDEALALYQDLLSQNAQRHGLWVQYGHALKAQGQTDDAINAYEKAVHIAADYGDAYWSLANTKTYRFTESMVSQMQALVSDDSTSLDDKIHVCFALGKAYEDVKQFQQAFHFYQQGNSLKNKTLNFDISRTERALTEQAQACTAELFADKAENVGCQAPDPIFIVGLPRAGSTLLEQILASHSMVDGTMELHDILGIASGLSQQQKAYPHNLTDLTDEQCAKLGEQYIQQTQAYRQGAPFFIDKMPNNFVHIGLIKRILPKAKIIDARRDPMACCFSGFKQLFADGQEFSYALEDIGRYYRAYEKLMAHWQSVLPGQILTVQHENVINDLEGEVKRILDFCGLPFEQACVDFYQTKRVIKTPSSEQVRQPIYRSGMTQWEGFSEYLSPLKQALQI
ncbi:tetratricopeptide repeat-containing sulfotransferase family protein [Alteromonas confluentis]|uniref:Sulfotransferase n=1 Tax=Alteromonas confluentis TaxID=1656094 RepID=A0A1E7Z946_9ALTE|nr:tetratricopeptide repeat-containing sulfotransferase family protein [Alteromonas confluentis]OFC70063.1 hypothetical protein BFC18_15125 [Alteromonas confluentis]